MEGIGTLRAWKAVDWQPTGVEEGRMEGIGTLRARKAVDWPATGVEEGRDWHFES